MSIVRSFIENQLLEPLKRYPTVIQDTMLEIIIQELETLYEYTLSFPEIVSPDMSRVDILRTIANQFLFTIRNDADLQEQVDILRNILYVYSKRGSVDTIENMWKYYGGELPKDVKVVIPSYDMFRYSISNLSGTHKFANDPEETGQGDYYRPGVYEVQLTNNTYPIIDLKQFMLDELVAAGNRIFFTNLLHMDSMSDNELTNPHKYDIKKNIELYLELEATYMYTRGLRFSNATAIWSGTRIPDFDEENPLYVYNYLAGSIWSGIPAVSLEVTLTEELLVYCTPPSRDISISSYSYSSQGESRYPGYFILGESLLGKEVV